MGAISVVTRACYQTSCNLARSKSLAIPPSLLKNLFPVQHLQNREPKNKLKQKLEKDITKAHFSDWKTNPCFELVLNLEYALMLFTCVNDPLFVHQCQRIRCMCDLH